MIFTALFAPAGDAAPDLWLFVARCGWLAAPLLAGVLARRLSAGLGRSESLLAAAIAALGVVLLSDPFTSWTRQFAGGLSEPLLVALVLGAVERQLSGRPQQALAAALGAALIRPEAWPFLAIYVAWLWRERLVSVRLLTAALAAVPVLWLVPDLLGSGSALTGAERARAVNGSFLGEAVESLGRSAGLVLWALWIAAAAAVISARRRGDLRVMAIAALALAWIAIVAVMAGGGYAGLPRFAAPAGALVCVLGGVGIAELVARVRRARRLAERLRRWPLGFLIRGRPYRRALASAALVAALALALTAQAAVRVAAIPGEVAEAVEFSGAVDDLDPAITALGSGSPRGCGEIVTSDLYTQTALAWKLELPLSGVGVRFRLPPRSGFVVLDRDAPTSLAAVTRARGEPLAENRSWAVIALGCDTTGETRLSCATC